VQKDLLHGESPIKSQYVVAGLACCLLFSLMKEAVVTSQTCLQKCLFIYIVQLKVLWVNPWFFRNSYKKISVKFAFPFPFLCILYVEN